MTNLKRIFAVVMVICMVAACFVGCGPEIPTTPTNEPTNGPTNGPTGGNENPTDPTQSTSPVVQDLLVFKEGTILRMACGYQKPNQGISFDADTAGEGITLADGVTYHTGDLKPTWVEVQNRLGMLFTDKFTGAGSAEKEFKYWAEQLHEVDMVAGSASILNEYGVAGKLVNIAEYLDLMPNFKAYLESNPIVRLAITGNTDTGAIYFSPYFDGVSDIERMPLMRTDWVEKLLNGEGEFSAAASGTLATAVYTPYMPTSGKVAIDVVKKDGSGVESITKNYDKAGNIVAKMNAAGAISGVEAVNMLRKYIDEAYNGYYGTNRADLFIGQNAAWDADELVALLRCVVSNAQTLNGTDTIYGLFSREDDNNQRRIDMFRFAGTLFGVRGLESRQDYLYVGADGKLHDSRMEKDTYEALARMNAMVQEGLISASFVNTSDEDTGTLLANDLGFMHYDYNQTQTVYNETKLQEGEKYMAVMIPVARWFDGTDPNGVYMRFTESWRSVKTDGWAISKAGVGDDQNKLYAALKLIDYAYSYEGQILMSYGPDSFIKTNADGSYVTFNFNGQQMPVISDATFAELWEKASGNYTNYARQYLGSTLSFMKSQAFEYQCTHNVGKEGAGHISTAIALGVIKHPELEMTANPWYTIVPTVLPLTTVEEQQIKDFSELSNNFNTSKGKVNYLVDLIVKGFAIEGMGSVDACVDTVSNSWNCKTALYIRNGAWELLQDYYASLLG